MCSSSSGTRPKKSGKLKYTKRDLERLNAQLEIINRKYDGAFEWRYEFPEVLDADGSFIGFDAVIGNPPYIRGEDIGSFKKHLLAKYETFAPVADILVFF